MPTTNIDQRVKILVGLTAAEAAQLNNDGIVNEEDLSWIDFADLDDSISVVKRRKLILIKKYLERGENLTATTTLQDIRTYVRNMDNPPGAAGNAAAAAAAAGVSAIDKGAPRVNTDPLPKFSGDPVDYEEWERKACALINQTVYKHYLNRAATNTDNIETARSGELYYMLSSCVGDGHALNTVEKVKDVHGECGYNAWKALKDWYMDPSQVNTMIAHYQGKLDQLYLDNDGTATEFINTFELIVRKLEKLEGAWTDAKKVREFKDRVVADDYDTEARVHDGTFAELVKIFRLRETHLEKKANMNSRKQRRFKAPEPNNSDSSDDKDGNGSGKQRQKPSVGNKVPFLPKFLFKSIKQKSAKKNLARWRALSNQGKSMVEDDMVYSSDAESKDGGSSTSSKKTTPPKKKKQRGARKTRRVTKVRFAGVPDDTVAVKLASDNEDYAHRLPNCTAEQASAFGYESEIQSCLHLSMTDEQKIRRFGSSVGASRGRSSHQPYAVIDEGATEELIGGDGWEVVHVSGRTETLTSGIEGMGCVTLPKVDAVTAVRDSSGNTLLLGLGNTTYDRRNIQYESLWNAHHLRDHGTIVDDVARKHGGKQEIRVQLHDGSYRRIPLDFDGRTMKVDLFRPTEEELTTLRVVWLTPTIDGREYEPQSIRRSRAAVEAFNLQVPGQPEPVPEEEKPTQDLVEEDQVKDWKALLGYPSDLVMEKTLNATTQLCAEPVEMERREIPRQHRKKRLLPLHPRRLKGRVDSDTFFSTVKSIRNYKCVQLFVHVPSDYLFIRCMQREAHSHGAYQDFIREVGAPELIVTDNSQTQTGKKWEATSRSIMTKQRKLAPHNQNQSKAERRIQDAKFKTVHVLARAGAPIEFWDYCLIYVIDCLNHVAKKSLNWKTSQEILNGDTADISAFRFKFWQEIEYFEPTAKFPKDRWQRGRYLGIDWESGDQFTFKIWTEPSEGGWKSGQELTRNIVRPRKGAAQTPATKDGDESMSENSSFKFQRYVATKKRRGRRRKLTYTLRDCLEFDQEEEGDQTNSSEVDERTVQGTSEPQVFSEDEDSDAPGGEMDDTEQNTSNQPTNPQSKNSTADGSEPPEPVIDTANIEMAKEVNEQFASLDEPPDIGGSRVEDIISHEWRLGQPAFKVKWAGSNDTTWELLSDMRHDYPRATAKYIVENQVSRSKRGGDRVLKWAKQVVRDMARATRRIARLYDFYLEEDESVKYIRRTTHNGNKKKKKPPPSKTTYKYGIEVPRNVTHAIEIDDRNGDTHWQDAMRLEVGALLDLDCFEFKPEGWTPGEGYQSTTLHMVFDVKHDLRRKARLVAGGHLVDVTNVPVYSSTVKSISVQLLHMIAHKAGLDQLCGDIGNAFPNAYTNEKVYIKRAGPEFGEFEGRAILIRKAIYGLASSSERFHQHLADTLRSFGWKPTRFDNDVWIRLDEQGKMYEYICSHVDDFMIVSKKPEIAMEEIQSVYLVKDSSKGPPDYYLGNDYKRDKQGRWRIGCKKYLTEAVERIERIFGELPKKGTPMDDGDHPEEDDSGILGDSDHQKYQMLIGMLNWIVCLGRMDVAFATASLSRFTACPRKGHMERALRVFGYLKKYKNRRVCVDSRDPILIGGKDALDKDFVELFKDTYPDAVEEIDVKIPVPLIDEMEITCFVDSDHAHDRVTRRSITGIIICVGRTPVFFSSKRQGAIETSTYGAEFCAMRTAVEEVQSVRYMLRCLGVKVSRASLICGDNMGVIQNSTIPDSLLKKKHVAIAFHKTREASASGMCHPIKILSKNNYADLLTKAVTGKTFWSLYGGLTRG